MGLVHTIVLEGKFRILHQCMPVPILSKGSDNETLLIPIRLMKPTVLVSFSSNMSSC